MTSENVFITIYAVIEFTINTSNHFVVISTIIKKYFYFEVDKYELAKLFMLQEHVRQDCSSPNIQFMNLIG